MSGRYEKVIAATYEYDKRAQRLSDRFGAEMRAIIELMRWTGLHIGAHLHTIAQAPDKASAQLVTSTPHFHGGDEVSFKMKLNEPLPEGARFDVRLSPSGLTQELTVSSQEPLDKDRKEFLLKLKLPEHARGGEWHVATVYLFLPGASWTGSTIATNLTFVVDGPNGPLPTSATATIEKK